MDPCPNCRARWHGAATCRRCGMELTDLVAAEQAAERHVAQAVARLEAGEHAAARRELALRLCRTPLAERLFDFTREIES